MASSSSKYSLLRTSFKKLLMASSSSKYSLLLFSSRSPSITVSSLRFLIRNFHSGKQQQPVDLLQRSSLFGSTSSLATRFQKQVSVQSRSFRASSRLEKWFKNRESSKKTLRDANKYDKFWSQDEDEDEDEEFVFEEDMPLFWRRVSWMLDSWLIEKRLSFNEFKWLREMVCNRDMRIWESYWACQEIDESEHVATFIKLITMEKEEEVSEATESIHIVRPNVDECVFRIVLVGYNAPVTAGNFVDLMERHFYDGMEIQRADGFVVQTGDPEGPAEDFIDPSTEKPRTVPLEIMVDRDKAPVYGETLEDLGRYKAQTKLPFNAFGTMAMAREEFDPNSASSQVFWLLKESELTPSNANTLDGRYAVFGYVTKNEELLADLKVRDVIEFIQVVSGLDNLANPSYKIVGYLFVMDMPEFDPNSASSQVFWLLKESELTPSNANTLDGRYAVFGYVTKNEELLADLKAGDVIEFIQVVSGLDNLANPSYKIVGYLFVMDMHMSTGPIL